MNILIDTSPLETASSGRGIGRYVKELVTALKRANSIHHIYTSADEPKHVDLIHYPFFDLFFPTLPLFKKTKTVVTIHDVIPLVFPKNYYPGIRGSINLFRQSLALRSVSHIISDSSVSKRDTTQLLHIRPEKISVVPLAAADEFFKRSQSEIDAVRKKYAVPKNYCLYVGDINYNKNLPFLISVMAKIPDVTLVMVGRAMKNTAIPEGKAIAKAIADAGSEKYVRLLDAVESQDELAALYSGARVYVQPSLYEGFGLPVLEAMRCKTPVVSSRGGSLPEVVGEMGFMFHPRDPHECEAAIRKALRLGGEERSLMVKKAFEYSQQYSWERTARETLAVYDQILK